MLPRPKFKYPANKKEILYFFAARSEFERCVARGCQLISRDNAHDASDFTLSIDLISSLAIEIWRLEKRINKAKDGMAKDENKGAISIIDQIQRIKDIFKKQEIKICEYTGTAYNDGLSLKALHFEEIDGLPKGTMKVIETVKPSVYFKGQVIFHGEVIVGKSKEK